MAAQGDLIEARELQERVVEGMRGIYGDHGLETCRAINNLAGTISAQGDLDTAHQLLQSVVATACREFGEDHPDTLTAMGNLAAVLWQQGDLDEAYALQHYLAHIGPGSCAGGREAVGEASTGERAGQPLSGENSDGRVA
jgi:hypothetical protein